MKKKKIKNLTLNKKSISKLNSNGVNGGNNSCGVCEESVGPCEGTNLCPSVGCTELERDCIGGVDYTMFVFHCLQNNL